MEFKTYDILSSLIPGFISLIGLLNFFEFKYVQDLVIVYTTLAFLIGYIINTLSSWMEGIYFITWGGKPSNQLISGKDIWKVRFYHSVKTKELLTNELNKASFTDDELFSVAMRYSNISDNRTETFNAIYAFSRSMLTTVLLAVILYAKQYHCDWRFYIISLPLIFICWLRCKQRGYYYAREVLTIYLKIKTS